VGYCEELNFDIKVMEVNLQDRLKERFFNVVGKNEDKSFVIAFQPFEDYPKLNCEFKTNFFSIDFKDFCIFESILTLTIADLYPYRDPMWKEIYQQKLSDGIGEVFVKIEPECKKYVIRTVIHCLEENRWDMINELVELHKKIHDSVQDEMSNHKV
jgi:hypothetical protein